MDSEGGHAVVCLCLPGRLHQVPAPPHCHPAPVRHPPQQGLSAALNMFECDRHTVVCVCVFQRKGRVVCYEGRIIGRYKSYQPRVEWSEEGGGDSGTVSVRARQKIDCYSSTKPFPPLASLTADCAVGEIVSACESQTNVVYKVDNRTGRLVDVTSGRTTRGWRQSLGLSAGESVHVEVCAPWGVGVWVFVHVFDKGDYMCCVRISPCGAVGAL